jgi:hypothetical protein
MRHRPHNRFPDDNTPVLPHRQSGRARIFALKLFFFVALNLLLISAAACTTLQTGIERTPSPNYSLTATISSLEAGNALLKTEIARAIQNRRTPTPNLTPVTTAIPRTLVPPAPRFTSLRFSPQPDSEDSRRFYVAGVPRICAIWDYSNMRDGLTIRRVWYLNGQEWILRDEPWDYAKYGSTGTIQDVCIFDENTGLQAGQYDLALLINGVPQDIGEGPSFQDRQTFWIFNPEVTSPVASQDGSRTAFVRAGSRLVVDFPTGVEREMVIAQEISSLNWFPDNRSLLYTERDRSRQTDPNEDIGITHKLWILDTETGERRLISTAGENFHNPQISPDGRYIAVLSGATFTNGCSSSPTLAIIQLDSEMNRRAVFRLSDFSGLPAVIGSSTGGPASNIFPTNPKSPGKWEDSHQLVTGLWWSCLNQENTPDGLYLLNLVNMEAGFAGSY